MLNIRIATPPFDITRGGFMKVNPGICSSYIFSRKPGDNVTMDITLITPIAMEDGLRFAIREGGRTVGAGVVAEIFE